MQLYEKNELLNQYHTEIEDILEECEHVYRAAIDFELLDQKVSRLLMCAKLDGLDEKLIMNFIHNRIPSYVNYLNHKMFTRKKVA